MRKKFGVAFIEREEKCNLPPLIILIVVGELFRLSLDVMEPFFLASIPFLLSKGKYGGCADIFDRIHKD